MISLLDAYCLFHSLFAPPSMQSLALFFYIFLTHLHLLHFFSFHLICLAVCLALHRFVLSSCYESELCFPRFLLLLGFTLLLFYLSAERLLLFHANSLALHTAPHQNQLLYGSVPPSVLHYFTTYIYPFCKLIDSHRCFNSYLLFSSLFYDDLIRLFCLLRDSNALLQVSFLFPVNFQVTKLGRCA